ncbi:MAG TPA: DUF4124 domain-containing protein [Pseudomonadales bacterium]
MHRHCRIALILAIMVASPWVMAGKIYQWRDATGKLHISDTPPPTQASPENAAPPLQTAPDKTLHSVEPPAGSPEIHRAPVNRRRINKSIEQYQTVQPAP